jgi:tetratricopeptide (TPR) repeat protein
MQAFLDPNFGFLMVASLAVLYFYLSHNNETMKQFNNLTILSISGFVISALIILLSLEPTKGIGVIPLDLLIFIGFTFMYGLGSLVRSLSATEETPKVVQICMLIVVSIALTISFVAFSKQGALFPSFSLSLKAVLQIFKNPLTALLGSGIDNYSSVFNRVKDILYNRTDLWQFPANVDRSALFHIVTTTGLAGLIALSYLLISLIKNIKKGFSLMLGLVYLLCVLVIFPPSFLIFFLLIFLTAQTGKNNKEYTFNLSKSFSLYSYIILIITACVLFGATIRYFSSLYLADYFYAQSLVGMKENSFKKVYDNQQKTLSYNPYLEQYHLGFARTHFVLAQNIIDKAASGSAPLVFTKENKQMLIEAIQVAINEAQTAVGLNPKKAEYWANLAQIYLIIPKELQAPNEKDANAPKTIAINLIKKAIELDPSNPMYYSQISQMYLAQQKTEEAFKYIKKATELKPNWADAHYQLAILYSQKNDMKNATKELEITLANLDPIINQKEYDVVKQTLDKIKNPPSNNQAPPAQPPAPAPLAQ